MPRWSSRLAAAGALILAAQTWLFAQADGNARAQTFEAAWKIIRDSHFDPGMNGVDWQAVRVELAPRAAGARSDSELRDVIKEMLGRLGLSHFALIPSGGDASSAAAADLSGDPGFDVRLVGSELVVTHVEPGSGAAAAGVKPGWRLLSIETLPAAELLARVPDTLPARLRQVEAWRLVETKIRGPRGSRASLMFDDGDRDVGVAVERRVELGQPATVGNLPTMYVRVDAQERRTPRGATVGIVGFNVWMPAVDAQFQKAVDRFRGHDGVVIDLRGNPGGLAAMIMGISGHFLTERTPLGTMKTRESELRFAANPRLVNGAGQRVEPYAGPVAILVDSLTGSASECFAGGLQSLRRARVFGQTSMGQALPAFFDKLPNGDVLIHATGDFVTADGTRLEGRGVIPDEPVALDRRELLAGRDATLAAALDWIDRQVRR
ncbi:MAG TPA: S41 family peptidase [Vicinamibacterales bacterium]|nr:S41 family peptidase [Vicinamibacterales bacterium]